MSPRFRARHPSGVWIPCPSCGLEQPEAPDCAVCGAALGVTLDANRGPDQDAAAVADSPRRSEPEVAASAPTSETSTGRPGAGRYRDGRRIELAVDVDYRGAELRHGTASPVVTIGVLALGAFLLFHAASWFIDFTRGEIRAMAEVVDRLALPQTACDSCEKPFRIVELRARPYYDPPQERMNLFDPVRDDASQRWVEQMRREVEETKAWAEEQRRWQEEQAARWREPED